MRISFDTNIFIAGIQATHSCCVSALDYLDRLKGRLLLSGMVEKEILRNLTPDEAMIFQQLLRALHYPVDHTPVPPELVLKYRDLGLKKGDMIIAAFCEFRQIAYFVSENRHFLTQLHTDAFRVVDAEAFIAMIQREQNSANVDAL